MKKEKVLNHNDYVFDFENNKFIGKFEEMYQKDEQGFFDSWQQDSMSLYKKIDLAIIEEYNFKNIIDLGCGKGYFTNLLKKRNNLVYGCDISKTAISIAKNKFKNITFDVMDINDKKILENYLKNINVSKGGALVVSRAIMYYLSNWKEVVEAISKYSDYAMFGLNIPPDTMGYIKSKSIFMEVLEKKFKIIENIQYENRNSFCILGRSLKT